MREYPARLPPPRFAMHISRSPLRVTLDSAQRLSWRALRAIMLSFFAAGALAAQPRTERSATRVRAASCLATSPRITDARLDDRHSIYVEQETASAHRDGRVLVAGEPVFVWAQRGERHELLEQDSLIGMVISPPSTVRALVSPLRGRSIGAMRSAALADGWWLVTFAEVVPASVPQRPKVLAMWSGETDGTTWRGVERLPLVPDSLDLRQLGQLSSRGGRAHLLVQSWSEGAPRVVLYSREDGLWSASSLQVGHRAYAAVATTTTHLVLAVVRPDTTEREDVNSLFVSSRRFGDSAWSPPVRVVRGFRSPVRDPLLTDRADGVLLSWRVESHDRRKQTAGYVNLGTRGELLGSPGHVASDAGRLVHASGGDRGVWSVMQNDGLMRRLQLVEHDVMSTPTAAVVSATTYGGGIAAALTSDYLVLIASRPGRSTADAAVVSSIRTYTWRCK